MQLISPPSYSTLAAPPDEVRFLVSYGPLALRDMEDYNLLILEAGHYGTAGFRSLKKEGKTYVAYISLTEVNEHASYFERFRGQCEDRNVHWGSWLINPGAPQVRTILLDLVHRYRDMGFDGLFFDTLDNTGPYGSKKEWKPGLIELLLAIRKHWPGGYFIQNGGLHLPAGLCDMVVKESVFGDVDLHTEAYTIRNEEIRNGILAELQAYGLPFAVLEYAATRRHYQALSNSIAKTQVHALIANLPLSGTPKFTDL